MINDINRLNISEECKNKLMEKEDYDILYSIAFNKDVVNNNLKLLSSYGIENLEKLFLNKPYIFIMNTEKLVKKFSKFNIPVFVQIINNDFNAIDKIFKQND